MPKKKLARKTGGGGAGPMPIRRRYERDAVEGRGKYPDPHEVRPRDRITSKEAMKLTTKAKPDDYDLAQWRRAALIDLSTGPDDEADRSKFLLPIRNPDGSLNFALLAEAETTLFAGGPKEAPIEKRRAAAETIIQIAGGGTRTVALSDVLTGHGQQEVDMDNDRMRLAQSLNARADEIMVSQNASYTEAVKLAAHEQEEDVTLADLEAYAEKKGIEPDGDAYRALQQDRLHRAQAYATPSEAGPNHQDLQIEALQIKRTAEARGYDTSGVQDAAVGVGRFNADKENRELREALEARGHNLD